MTSGSAVVRLDQFVSISGGDEALRSRLGSVELRLVSPPGAEERVTRDDVSALVALRMPDLASPLLWKGSSTISRIRVQGRPLDLQQLTQEGQALLEDWLRARVERFKVVPLSDRQIAEAESAADETATLRPFAGPVSARTALWVDLARPGRPARGGFPIWFAVEAWADAPVAATDIIAGTRLSAEQVSRSLQDIAALGPRPLLTDADIPESVAVAPIRQGEALTRDRFRQATPVVAGDEVRLRVQDGPMRVEAHGIALESGGNGQRIRVRNSGSGEVLVASVAGKGLVEVAP